MIFEGGNIDRLNYGVAKVLEIDDFLIINGETYDKTNLFKMSDYLVEYGLGYGNSFFLKFFQTSWFSSNQLGGMRSGNQSFITNYLRNKSKLCGALSVYDNQNPNIIHAIAGETAIELNILTMKYKVARNKTNKYGVLNCAFIHQNDDYIYFISQYVGETDKVSNGCHYIFVYDKKLKTITYKTQFGTINTAYALNVIHKENSNVYLSSCVGGVFTLHKIVCEGEAPIVSAVSLLKPANYAKTATMCVVASQADKNGVFYKLCNLYNISFEKIENQILTESGLDTMMTDASLVKVDECLKNKYELDTIDEATRKTYMPMIVTNSGVASGVGGRLWECMLVDAEKYLIIQHTTCNSTINPTNNDWIAIFKRNDESNPLDLTMTDFLRFSELSRKEQPCKHFSKVTEELLSAVGTNIVFQLRIKDGKFVEDHLFIDSIYGFGYDEKARYYYTQSTNDNLSVESQSYPSIIELSYVKSNDAFVEYDGKLIKRDVVVTTKNKNGELSSGNFELYSSSALFSNNALSIKGKTDTSGKAIIPISFHGASDCVITGKILGENEV